MNAQKPGVDEVYTALLERIGSGVIEVGDKLQSCRELANEFGSNPSTVNRAIRRLARHGLVRTEPRRGTFLVNAGAAPELGLDEVERVVRNAVLAARRSGLGPVRIRKLFESALAVGSRPAGAVAFVECNPVDLKRMSTLVENTTGVALRPMMLDELRPGWEEDIDVLATPMFHLADLVEVSANLDKVVEVNFVPSASVLRELSMLSPSAVVAVMAPTARGVDRMRALVSQYYAGALLTPDLNDPAPFDGVGVVVHPAAMDLDANDLASVPRTIVIDWDLDPASASTFAGRVAAALER
ncbi:MAG TPA: GntR family transcriptional regulator [Acidimicrobiia bacterium]|jgi:DNA-binding transcriptional regulator YhcF (GntR family)|nr:GntR family transcriptional regulator [Acidimicrobiia bacterium]